MLFLRAGLLVCVLGELGVLTSGQDVHEYSNHWSSFYEKPCCVGQRHLRHHK
ncbi:hypothetical protein LSTR_LSTR011083, partial [Laodelphax striatellus]